MSARRKRATRRRVADAVADAGVITEPADASAPALARYRAALESRFYLRIHMTLLLGATFASGVVATNLLLRAGLYHLTERYILAVCGAYLVFLGLVRLWLIYVGADRRGIDLGSNGIDIGDLGGIGGSDASDTAGEVLHAGGGRFGGGGATGSWGTPTPVKSSGSSALDFGDLDDLWIVVLLIALVLALLAIAVYLIWVAPAILSEAAFDAALAGALARRAKKMSSPGWVGAVWRATVVPFLVVLVLAGALGWAAERRCPEAKRLSEALHCPGR
ncbi:MAG TPA: hypothetical protein VF824_05670 [Thermoanaerobaculia bacterium]